MDSEQYDNILKQLHSHYMANDDEHIFTRCQHDCKVLCFASNYMVHTERSGGKDTSTLDNFMSCTKTAVQMNLEDKHVDNLAFPV